MMRLVFLFVAEERGLLLARRPALRRELRRLDPARAAPGGAPTSTARRSLERRHDAWNRLLATFRAVHGGVEHDAAAPAAYGGGLFDPDRFPFLEGRDAGTGWRDDAAAPLPVDNRTVLHLLDALQVLRAEARRRPAEAPAARFRALDVEQIGHVYEGLLDHTARARRPTPRSGSSGKLESRRSPLARARERPARGRGRRSSSSLKDETGRVAGGDRARRSTPTPDAGRARAARRLRQRRRRCASACCPSPGCCATTCAATRGVPAGQRVRHRRRATAARAGTHYTPRALAEEIVQHALEPLVYARARPRSPTRSDWKLRARRRAARPQGLRHRDGLRRVPGRGLPLPRRAAARGLGRAERRRRSARRRHARAPTRPTTPRRCPPSRSSASVLARRLVAERCLYGVDKNPMAVEMAKLSLWLVTLAKDRPFTFLDHALRAGDSLLGVTTLDQLESLHLDPAARAGAHRPGFGESPRTSTRRSSGRSSCARELEAFVVRDVRDAERKARPARARPTQALDDARLLGDLVVGAALSPAGDGADALDDRARRRGADGRGGRSTRTAGADDRARCALTSCWSSASQRGCRPDESTWADRRPFHWALEFPEVLRTRRVRRDRRQPAVPGRQEDHAARSATDYRDYLVAVARRRPVAAAPTSSPTSSCAPRSLLRRDGGFGLIATNTIAQGDTREVGLDQLAAERLTTVSRDRERAVARRREPRDGDGLGCDRGAWTGDTRARRRGGRGITSSLDARESREGTAAALRRERRDRSFHGLVCPRHGLRA